MSRRIPTVRDYDLHQARTAFEPVIRDKCYRIDSAIARPRPLSADHYVTTLYDRIWACIPISGAVDRLVLGDAYHFQSDRVLDRAGANRKAVHHP